VLRLLLSLLLTAATVVMLLAAQHTDRLLSYSNSTSPRVTLTASYRLSAALCDSQETTTTVGETPPSTVGVPCDPTDLAASQTEYLGLVSVCLLLFGLFFLIGFKLWT